MYLDEKLVQIELKKSAVPDSNEEIERIKEEILRQEREQKPIADFVAELNDQKVVIRGMEYDCEKQSFLNGHIGLYMFPQDIEKIMEEDQAVSIVYNTLEAGVNLMLVKGPLVIKNEKEYQNKMKEQFRKDKISYAPLDTGRLRCGDTKVSYASGITTSTVGGVFVIHFYYPCKAGIILGSFTCQLLERYTFEHLFLAMLETISRKED